MSDAHPDTALLRSMREEATALAKSLPGPLERIELRAGDSRLLVEWAGPGPAHPAAGQPAGTWAPGGAALAGTTGGADGAGEADAEEDPIGTGHALAAPLVGTFYRAPEPGADPFVEEGARVDVGDEVAIVEAMKIMNRIEADAAGTIRRILVADGDMVEFGQPLMVIDPD